MNRHASQFVTPAAVGGIAASVTFLRSPHGGLRILQILWLGLSHDNMLVAALIHGIVIGALTYVIMWPFLRRRSVISANLFAVAFLCVYLIAYFSIGIPMVG